jgi:L,D-transpeptidase ErfK/SrfK
MRLAIPGGAYLIHGTNRPAGVGMQVTHGCIRMYPEDIAEFFKIVAVNTPVRIIDQPYKMGWSGEDLFIEIHAPLEGGANSEAHSLTNITRLLVAATQDRPVPIDWAKAEQVFMHANGVPERVVLRPATTQVAGSAESSP